MIDTTYHEKPIENRAGVVLLDAILRGTEFFEQWLAEYKKHELPDQRISNIDPIWLMRQLAKQADEKLKEKSDVC
jgi:hypothetical protein